MENNKSQNMSKLNYANLSQSEEDKLREVEKSFNNQFETNYYFMVINKN